MARGEDDTPQRPTTATAPVSENPSAARQASAPTPPPSNNDHATPRAQASAAAEAASSRSELKALRAVADRRHAFAEYHKSIARDRMAEDAQRYSGYKVGGNQSSARSGREGFSELQDDLDNAGERLADWIELYGIRETCQTPGAYKLPRRLRAWAKQHRARTTQRYVDVLVMEDGTIKRDEDPATTATAPGPLPTRSPTTTTTTTSASDRLALAHRHATSIRYDTANGYTLLNLPQEARDRIGDDSNILTKGSLHLILSHSVNVRPAHVKDDLQLIMLHVKLGTTATGAQAKFITCLRLDWVTFDFRRVVIQKPISWQQPGN